MLKNAIIVNSVESYHYSKKHNNMSADIFADNYLTKTLLQDSSVGYLYRNIECNESHVETEKIWNFFLNWYRSKEGKDLLEVEGFSIGPMLSRRAMMAFVVDLKNYNALNDLMSKYDNVYLPNDISESLKRVARNYDLNWYDAIDPKTNFVESTPERGTYYKHPSIHRLSFLARFTQKPFKFLLRRKNIIYFRDWTSIGLAKKRKDTLIENSFNILNGCYFKFDKDYCLRSEIIFPKNISTEVMNLERLNNVANGFNIDWCDEIILLFINHLKYEYDKFRDFFVQSYAIYWELFDYYKPKGIVLAGENEFHNIIVAHLAKKMNIATTLLIDGYQSTVNMFNLFMSFDNKSFLFDQYCAQGQANFDLLIDSGLGEDKCKLIYPPIINLYNNLSEKTFKDVNRVIIMAYLPNLSNPSSQYDFGIKVEIDIISMLYKLGYHNIGIKIKKGRWSTDKTVELYKQILELKCNIKGEVNIEVINGHFFECVRKANFIIGGISTANIEAHYCKVPFFIYEPFENGQSDFVINSSKIFSVETVSRDIESLSNNIKNKSHSINKDYNYIFSGPGFDSVQL